MEEKKRWFNFKHLAQWAIFIWFSVLTFIAVYNLSQNRLDQTYRQRQAIYLQADEEERKLALAEHQFLRTRIIYLEGQLDALHKQRKTPNYQGNTTP